MYDSLTRTRSGPACVPLKGGKDPRQRVGGPLPAPGESMYTRTKYQQGRRPSPPCRGGGPLRLRNGGGGMRSWKDRILWRGYGYFGRTSSNEGHGIAGASPFSCLPLVPLLSIIPAKYRLSPMPPPPSLRMVPRPCRADFWLCTYFIVLLLSIVPAKYRLPPMPPPPCLRTVPSCGISDHQNR